MSPSPVPTSGKDPRSPARSFVPCSTRRSRYSSSPTGTASPTVSAASTHPPPSSSGPSASPTGAGTTSSPSKTPSRPASEKISTTGSAAGWKETKPSLLLPRGQPTEGDGGIELHRPPASKERGPTAGVPQRDALAAHEPAYGHGGLPGEQLDVAQPGPAVPVQVLNQRSAQRDRLGEPGPDRTTGRDLRDVTRAQHRGDELIVIQRSDQLDLIWAR